VNPREASLAIKEEPMIEQREIAFVDLGQKCPGGCSTVGTLLRCAFPADTVHHYGGFHEMPPPDAPPHLLIMRQRRDRISQAIESLPADWVEVPVLALCCDGFAPAGPPLEPLASQVDDFTTCPVRVPELIMRVRRLLDNQVRSTVPRKRRPLDTLIGSSPCFLRALATLSLMARSEATVVLSGETGTGKELFARAIHYMSPRMGHPFIPVNCGSVPDHLLENELFGHVRGAYTDAATAAPGLLKAAEGGTLFLDEVDTLTPAAQVKLLRFLQDREYRPLGSAKPVTASVRVVAAANVDLQACVRERVFREDLYHRLNVLSLRIPALRERLDDVPRLAEHFLKLFALRERREPCTFTPDALHKLVAYSWPGNVRQLEAVVQRAVILVAGRQIAADDIDLPGEPTSIPSGALGLREAKARAIEQFERAYLTSLLAIHRGNLSRAARDAGKERRSLQRLLQKHHLLRGSFE
jgi:DNA-binding NtrC family response regulator